MAHLDDISWVKSSVYATSSSRQQHLHLQPNPGQQLHHRSIIVHPMGTIRQQPLQKSHLWIQSLLNEKMQR
jgi:hypothetical protein